MELIGSNLVRLQPATLSVSKNILLTDLIGILYKCVLSTPSCILYEFPFYFNFGHDFIIPNTQDLDSKHFPESSILFSTRIFHICNFKYLNAGISHQLHVQQFPFLPNCQNKTIGFPDPEQYLFGQALQWTEAFKFCLCLYRHTAEVLVDTANIFLAVLTEVFVWVFFKIWIYMNLPWPFLMFVFHQILQLQQKTKRTDYNTLGPFHNRYSLKDNNKKKGHILSSISFTYIYYVTREKAQLQTWRSSFWQLKGQWSHFHVSLLQVTSWPGRTNDLIQIIVSWILSIWKH